MPADERCLHIDRLMGMIPVPIRYDYKAVVEYSPLIGITAREHLQWVRRHPFEDRSMINDTDFKPKSWSNKVIRMIRRGRK